MLKSEKGMGEALKKVAKEYQSPVYVAHEEKQKSNISQHKYER